jgi:hypothetical protein
VPNSGAAFSSDSIVIEMQVDQTAAPWQNGDYRIRLELEAVGGRQFVQQAVLSSIFAE